MDSGPKAHDVSPMTEVTGRCLCGGVRFRFGQLPIATRMCWCRDCQYLSAGNASIGAIFRTETLEVAGETREYVSCADSGSMVRRRFCPKCGTPLFSEALDCLNFMVVRAGTLDNSDIAKPSSAIWTKSAPSWAHVDAGLPTTEGQPTPISEP